MSSEEEDEDEDEMLSGPEPTFSMKIWEIDAAQLLSLSLCATNLYYSDLFYSFLQFCIF